MLLDVANYNWGLWIGYRNFGISIKDHYENVGDGYCSTYCKYWFTFNIFSDIHLFIHFNDTTTIRPNVDKTVCNIYIEYFCPRLFYPFLIYCQAVGQKLFSDIFTQKKVNTEKDLFFKPAIMLASLDHVLENCKLQPIACTGPWSWSKRHSYKITFLAWWT